MPFLGSEKTVKDTEDAKPALKQEGRAGGREQTCYRNREKLPPEDQEVLPACFSRGFYPGVVLRRQQKLGLERVWDSLMCALGSLHLDSNLTRLSRQQV